MTNKLARLFVALAAVLAFGAGAARAQSTLDKVKQEGKLVVGVKADYRPYGFRNPQGEIVGFGPDLAADVAKRLGVDLELVPVVASNRMQFLNQGKIDLMIATMSDTPERRKVVSIVDPDYFSAGVNVLAPKSVELQSWDDLEGKPVCAIQGSFYNKEIAEKYGADLVAFPGTAEVLTALQQGRCVGFLYDDSFIVSTLQESGWQDYEMPLESIDEVPWGVAVKNGETKFRDFMSDVVKDWHKSGFILSEAEKWGIKPGSFVEKMNKKYQSS